MTVRIQFLAGLFCLVVSHVTPVTRHFHGGGSCQRRRREGSVEGYSFSDE